MNLRRLKDQTRQDYLRRLASMKEQQPKQSQCRAWIAKFEGRWHWSSPSNLQLPNPFRN
jgi:hypothetical protein